MSAEDRERFFRDFDVALECGAGIEELWAALDMNAVLAAKFALEQHLELMDNMQRWYPDCDMQGEVADNRRHIRQVLELLSREFDIRAHRSIDQFFIDKEKAPRA